MADDILRTFFGFELPREVSARAALLRTLVRDPKRAVRWVKGINIHLTVRFIGATPRAAVEQLSETVKGALDATGPMKVSIGGTGVFPSGSRPRVLWLGVNGDVAGLLSLEQTLSHALEPLGFPREERNYVPHITLGRVRYPQKITPDVGAYLSAEYEPVDCELRALHLYESRTGETGLTYIPLATYPLTTSNEANHERERTENASH